jgi:Tetratricopeptide repeat
MEWKLVADRLELNGLIYFSGFVDVNPSTATSLNNLALLYKSTGRYSEAEPLLV